MTLSAEIYEMNYSCSPGGVDCWEVTIQHYGHSENYSDFKSAGKALDFLLNKYPGRQVNVDITSLSAYNILMEKEEV